MFGHQQHKKDEVRYLENIFSDFRSNFSVEEGVFHKSCKSKYHSIYKYENFETRFVRENPPPFQKYQPLLYSALVIPQLLLPARRLIRHNSTLNE